ncbi:hypothetical protein ALC62_08902 [Cyphomyrmex costatus]|uniref:Uncharacterized protein n=1 Tax=Cyphomyrmex costatus TaxID=456900 RepID=A0A195CI44_9HYME|nr:hypothetical protein ALC62_08902 [Cyphomyrmex costatus]
MTGSMRGKVASRRRPLDRLVAYFIQQSTFLRLNTFLPFRNARLACTYRSAFNIVIKAKEKNVDEAVLEIKVQPVPVKGKTINCADFVQDMCFWNTSRYKIYENQPVTMIGMFGPEAYNYVCPEFRVTRYELLNGKYLQ